MKRLYKDYLFQKHILVSEASDEKNAFEVVFSLANLFGIRIVSGEKLAETAMISYVSEQLGERVPEPFYRGFPESVRALTEEQLLFDQMLHYFRTYWMGDFSEAGHSIFEEQFERTAFKENIRIKEFSILSEADADKKLEQIVSDLLAGTRPLSELQYNLICNYIVDYNYLPSKIASKNTAVRLLLDLRNINIAQHLKLSDVIKIVDELNYRSYGNTNVKKLNLKNQDRIFISSIIDLLAEPGKCDIENCCEKKQVWNGLLHHIHYRAKTEQAKAFVDIIRGKENLSAYSAFEKAMASGDIREAVLCLKKRKGSGAVLRNLNYIISRCSSDEDLNCVIDCLDSRNPIVLIQLLIQYAQYRSDAEARTFKFTKYNRLRVHTETEEECTGRRSLISTKQRDTLSNTLKDYLKQALKGRLGKVYIDPDMAGYALPLQENTSQGGFGVLPKGSRIHIENAKIIRAFTYWEKVNDIDLSVFGIDALGRQTEFSWRTMAGRKSDAIIYSGDQTSGYYGGSEYFDIHVEKFRKQNPDILYLIFCDNVFSYGTFQKCLCKAGFMLRDTMLSGQIFEPKTVESSFTVNCDSRFAYLFGIDLKKDDFVWLNLARDSSAAVAGTTSMSFLTDYFRLTDIINQYTFFEMMAEEVVPSPDDAEVIVTDKSGPYPECAEIIREYDFERMIALMN